MDIVVFGPEVSLGIVHYGLLFTDRYSRITYIYPLQNLTTDIIKQMAAFFAHLGTSPKCLISNFDTKLIGRKAREYLNSLKIHVNAALANRQDKNRLLKRQWQTMTAMARNWLASVELPTTFWYYAVKRAAHATF
jgi:cellulose synthase/poly-beta-1,6-N-acetylglucosamine synthase-like glycosyltransferase